MEYTTTEHPMVEENPKYQHLSNVWIPKQGDPLFYQRLRDYKFEMFGGVGIATRSNLGRDWEHYFTSQPYKKKDDHTGDVLDWIAMDFKKP
jgi:hypothetical protein